MNITDVKFRKMFDTEPLRAICSVTLDEEIAIHDIKIVSANGRLILAMPARVAANGNYIDVVHPINSDSRKKLEEAVIGEYLKITEIQQLS